MILHLQGTQNTPTADVEMKKVRSYQSIIAKKSDQAEGGDGRLSIEGCAAELQTIDGRTVITLQLTA